MTAASRDHQKYFSLSLFSSYFLFYSSFTAFSMVTWLENVYLAYKYHIELRNFPIYQTLFGISLGKQTVMVQQKCQSNHAVPGHRSQVKSPKSHRMRKHLETKNSPRMVNNFLKS